MLETVCSSPRLYTQLDRSALKKAAIKKLDSQHAHRGHGLRACKGQLIKQPTSLTNFFLKSTKKQELTCHTHIEGMEWGHTREATDTASKDIERQSNVKER